MKLSPQEDKVVAWHEARNLIDGTTDEKQAVKLLEEFLELICALYPDNHPAAIVMRVKGMLYGLHSAGRIKTVPRANAQPAKEDAIGDMAIILMNLTARNKTSLEACIEGAYEEIKDRKGKMIDGSFVKEEDLPDGIRPK